MGVWPAARTSDRRLFACCVMRCWPVRWCNLRRPVFGTRVMAVQLGSSHTAFSKLLENCMSPAFLAIWDYGSVVNLDSPYL